jgi:hypothetical protein
MRAANRALNEAQRKMKEDRKQQKFERQAR